MSTTTAVPLWLFTGASSSDDPRDVLTRAGYEVAVRALNEPALGNGQPAQLLVVDGARHAEQALRLCQSLRILQPDAFVPILYLTDSGAADTRLACLEAGADACLLRPYAPAELLAQVQALLRIKQRHDQLAVKAAEASRVNKRLQAVHQQIDQELALARRLQESFLPQTLPRLPHVRFAVKYRPCAQVGGDFYDVFRLDENHLGFYVADAMGHGVPASLLTVFVKQGVKAKEITGQSYRLVPPNEVLGRLNRDLIAQALSDVPFITMVYVLYNHADGTLQFSRAGHPHPLYIPAEGPIERWQIEGSLLGVFETTYRLQTQRLQPGDKLLLYTDGLDAAAYADWPVGLPSVLAAVEKQRQRPIDELIEHLASDLFTQTRQNDDLTLLGLEVVA